MTTFILTWNPDKWAWEESGLVEAISRTAQGQRVHGRWSIGNRKGGISEGQDRAFLLRQGREPRGIVASGAIVSAPFPAEHWDEARSDEQAMYVYVLWDRVLDETDILPFTLVAAQVSGLDWNHILSGGRRLPPPGDEQLERLWAGHVGPKSAPGPPAVSATEGGQAWQSDPARRRAVEDYGQRLLEEHYREQGWHVQDKRYGNSFDAVATKGTETLYLEAKGTESDGLSVLVTRKEVEFARDYPGECVLGVVSNIRFLESGLLDESSGTLALHVWDPDTGSLRPDRYRWTPPGD